MKFLIAIGVIVILVGTPLTVIALGKSAKICTAAGCDAAKVAAHGKSGKQRGAKPSRTAAAR